MVCEREKKKKTALVVVENTSITTFGWARNNRAINIQLIKGVRKITNCTCVCSTAYNAYIYGIFFFFFFF